MPRGSARARFSGKARADLERAAVWYESRRSGLGKTFADAVHLAVDLIAEGPQRWPLRNGTRRFVLRRFPYTITYRIDGTEVIVLAVAHHRIDPTTWEG